MFGLTKKSPADINIEVLQNGQPLAEFKQPLRQKGNIIISPTARGNLKLPFYPVSQDIDLFKTDSTGSFLTVDHNWHGFVTSAGEVIELGANHKTPKEIPMKMGDYGSFYFDDLRILIRIGPTFNKPAPAPKIDPAYRGSFFPLWIGDKQDFQTIAVATVITIACFAGFITPLMLHHDSRPKKLEDLEPLYTLSFIHPEHLRTAPEALQEHIDRSRLHHSVIDFYRSFMALLFGHNRFDQKYLFSTSIERFGKMYAEAQDRVDRRLSKQLHAENEQLSSTSRAMVHVLAIKGESLNGSLLRIFDKMDIFHQAMTENVASKRTIIENFKTDPHYDYQQYKDIKLGSKGKEALSKIKPFHILTNEQTMYKAAKDIADLAAMRRKKIKSVSQAKELLTINNSAPIEIESAINYATFITRMNLENLDQKLTQIHASEFGKPQAEKIREPLIGEIDPFLIEKAINRNKFELQLCYELALRKNQLLQGKMEWSWRIDSRGAPSEIALLDSTIGDRTMARCIRKKIATWTFPRPRRGSVEVRYPFNFAPAKG